jgi:methylthioribulose-1-phosphate dehydratase
VSYREKKWRLRREVNGPNKMSERATFSKQSGDLADAGCEFYRRGWVLGTSGNFSKLLARDPMRIMITASGIEKGELGETSFLEVDEKGDILQGFGKPSAETLIHLTIYRAIGNVASVLHTHSVWGAILSDVFLQNGAIEIEGYEMLKGLSGVTTHEHTEQVPIVANSQDYVRLAETIEKVINERPDIHGIYLHRHGLYTWGESVSEARRHVEIFEFLFEVLGRSRRTA